MKRVLSLISGYFINKCGKKTTSRNPDFIATLFFNGIAFLSLLGGMGCGSSSQKIDCPTKKAIPPDNPNITAVNIFLDVSGSMQGFMPVKNNGTDFQKLVPDLIERLNKNMPPANLLLLAQKYTPVSKIAIDRARENIAYARFSFGNSSALPAMLDTTSSYAADDKVSMLITDGIYSPVAGKIRLRDQVITDIRSSMTKVATKNYTVSCFQVHSQFSNVISPYYLFVIGKSQNVWAVRAALEQSLLALQSTLASITYNEVSFGFPETTPFYSIIPYVDNTGAGEPTDCPEWENRFLTIANTDVKMELEYWTGIDLSALPRFAQDQTYLRNNLVVEARNMEVKIMEVLADKQKFLAKLEDPTDKRLAGKCTHFIRIKVESIGSYRSEINLSLKKSKPGWIAACSHAMEDSVETKRDKTFGLINTTDGIADAYQNRESSFFFKDLKILVLKR